jgi:hypothetical protein
VIADLNNDGKMDFTTANYGTPDSITTFKNTATTTLFTSTTGNVGIGTSNPTESIHILGTGVNTNLLLENGLTANHETMVYFKKTGESNPEWAIGRNGYVSGLNESHFMILNQDAYPMMVAANNGNFSFGSNINTAPVNTVSVYGSLAVGATYASYTAPTNGAIIQGNVGIGTTNPSSFKLELTGSIGPSADDTYDLGSDTRRWRDLYLGPASLHIGSSTADGYSMTYDTTNNRLGFNYQNSGNPEVTFDSSGNLGIGTTNPGAALQIGSTFKITSAGAITGASGNVSMFTNDNNYVTGTPWTGMGYITNDTSVPKGDLANSGTLGFTWSDAEVSDTLTASSVPWTGVSSRPTALSSFTNDLGNYGGFVTGTPWTGYGYVTGTPWTGYGYLTAGSTLNGLVQSTAGGSSYFTGGNLGVGTNAPTAKLYVSGSGYGFSNWGTQYQNSAILALGDSLGNTGDQVAVEGQLYPITSSAATNSWRIPVHSVLLDGAGGFLAGTNLTAQQYVSSTWMLMGVNAYVASCPSGFTCYSGYFSGAGSGYPVRIQNLSGGGTRGVSVDNLGVLVPDSSDRRLKKNISTITTETDVLDALEKLRGVYFNWDTSMDEVKNHGEQRQIGMIAQEVQAVLPELVSENANGYLSLNYAQMSGFLVEVSKAQELQISTLSGKLASMNQDTGLLNINSDNTVKNTSSGQTVTSTSSFAESVIGKIRSGLVATRDLAVENITISGQSLRDYILGVISTSNLQFTSNNQTITSPLASIDTLEVNTIRPVTLSSGIAFKLGNGQVLTITGETAVPVAVIDALGNISTTGNISAKDAEFTGMLTSDQSSFGKITSNTITADTLVSKDVKTDTFTSEIISATNATVSGSVIADNVVTKFGDIDTRIAELQSLYATMSAGTNSDIVTVPSLLMVSPTPSVTSPISAEPTTTPVASPSATPTVGPTPTITIEPTISPEATQAAIQLAPDITPTPTPDLQINPDATMSALISQLSQPVTTVNYVSDQNIAGKIDNLTVNYDLAVLGNTSLGSTSIAGALLIDGSIRFSGNSIDSLSSTLYIQKNKLAGIDIMDGLLAIDPAGNVTINGNLTVTGNLAANVITPLSENLTVNLSPASPAAALADRSGFGKFNVKAGNDTVASINAQGSATFSGTLAGNVGNFGKLVIAAPATPEGTVSAQISSNATVGTGTLSANELELTILNTQITQQSYIYITPVSSTDNQVLYVKSKSEATSSAPGSFTVGFDSPVSKEVKFNWWIIN